MKESTPTQFNSSNIFIIYLTIYLFVSSTILSDCNYTFIENTIYLVTNWVCFQNLFSISHFLIFQLEYLESQRLKKLSQCATIIQRAWRLHRALVLGEREWAASVIQAGRSRVQSPTPDSVVSLSLRNWQWHYFLLLKITA